MSQYLNYFIEFKGRDAAEWRLLSAKVKKESVSYLPEGGCFEDENFADGDYADIHKDSVCGSLRDRLRVRTAGGFPENMSAELRGLCEKVDEANKARAAESTLERRAAAKENPTLYRSMFDSDERYEKYLAEEVLPEHVDDRFNKGFVTLSELYSEAEAAKRQAEAKAEEIGVMAKMDRLEKKVEMLGKCLGAYVRKEEFVPESEETDNEREDAQWQLDDLGDEMEDCDIIMGFCDSVLFMVNFLTSGYYAMEDVRIVYYIS